MRKFAVPLIVLSLSLPTHAQLWTVTFTCKGMITNGVDGTPEPISMGMTINFTTHTVHGFGGTPDVKITYMDEAIIAFDGIDPISPDQLTHWDIRGKMNRLSGEVEATSRLLLLKTGTIGSLVSCSLNCKPA